MNNKLKEAAQEGDIDLLYTLIHMDPYILENIEAVPFVDTPLHIAASAGHTSFATEILRLKPPFAWKLNLHGFSPIHLALIFRHHRMVCRFIDINKDLVRVKGREGFTPLHLAAEYGQIDLLVKFLLACPSAVEDVTVRSETVLHIAVKYKKFDALQVLVGWLQKSCHKRAQAREKSILNWKDEAGNTILHLSVLQNEPQVVRMLIDSKIDLNAKNLEDSTALDVLEYQTQVPNAEIRNMLIIAGGLRDSSVPVTPLLEDELRSKITFNEKIAISATRLRRRISNDTSRALLVVAILLATTTYEASLNPPGIGGNTHKKSDSDDAAGNVAMKIENFIWFWSLNSCAFYVSVLMICLLMPRGRISVLITSPLMLFSCCYVSSIFVSSPSLSLAILNVVIPSILFVCYCWATYIYVRVAKKLPGYGTKKEDRSKFLAGNSYRSMITPWEFGNPNNFV